MSGDAASTRITLDDMLREMRALSEPDINAELAMHLLSHLHIMQDVALQKLRHATAQRNTSRDYNNARRGFKGSGRANGCAHLHFSHGGRGRASTTMSFNR